MSPYGLAGEHDASPDSPLEATAIDAVHRVVTDQTRITKSWIQENSESGLAEGKYVELVGVAVCVFGIDEFCRSLGLPLEPLPAAIDGQPTEYVPAGLESETAIVSVIGADKLGPAESDLWPPNETANVIRALSLVPDAVREWVALSEAQYLAAHDVGNPAADTNRALNRMQMELVAGRVSSSNECFY